MNRLVATALAAACTAVLAAAPTAQAAGLPDPTTARWEGTFDAAGKFVRDDINPDNEGTRLERVQTVRSTCAGTAACGSIKVARSLSDGSQVKYTAQRSAPGVYQGATSYEASWSCVDRQTREPIYTWTGKLKDSLTVRATAADSAGVTRYKSTLTLSYPPFRTTADVPRACKRYFQSQGLENGDRPVVKTVSTATRRG